MSDDESLIDDSLLLDDDENSGKAIAKWDSGKWVRVKSGSASTKVVKFMFEDVTLANDQELPVCWLQWDLGDLHLAFPQGENEKIKVLEIDADAKQINVVTDISYKGSIDQFLRLENLDSKEIIEIVKISNLFKFIKNYQLRNDDEDNDEEKQQEHSLEVIEEETSEIEEIVKNENGKRTKRGKTPRQPKIPKFTKPKEPSVSEIENQVIINLNERILNEKLPKSTTRLLSIEVLESDLTFRSVSETNVNFFIDLMKKETFNTTAHPFMVNKMKDSGKYSIFDGNCRFVGIMKHNAETEQPILTVNCNVYDNLDFDQMVLIKNEADIKSPQSEITVLQKAKLAQKVITKKHLSVPTKSQEAEFQKLMKTYCSSYITTCTDLLRLAPEILNKIYEITCSNISIEHLPLNSTFWSTFISAVKKDSTKAMEYLATIKSSSDIKDIQKKLKDVKSNLLDYLSKRADHTYKTEQEAIDDLSGLKNITKENFIKALHDINFLHNKDYEAKNADVWEGIKKRLKVSFDKNLDYKNVKYMKEINENLLSKQNFVVIENPTVEKAFVELIEKFHENFVILALALCGEDVPKLSNCSPTAEFDVQITGWINIDKITDSMPKNTIEAALYIPNAPTGGNVQEKSRFLSGLCIEKKCRWGSNVPFDDIHEFLKLSEDTNNALICCSSLKTTKHFLLHLKKFETVIVMGDEKHRDLASSFTPVPKTTTTKKKKKTVDTEPSLQPNEE